MNESNGVSTVHELVLLRAHLRGTELDNFIENSGEWQGVSWNQVVNEVQETAKFLLSHGVQKGDRIVIASSTSLAWEIIHLAILKCGGVMVAIDKGMLPVSYKALLLKIHPVAIIADAPTFLEESTQALPPATIAILQSTATPRKLVTLNTSHIPAVTASTDLPRVEGRDLATIVFTSGTTGEQKLVAYRHEQIVLAVRTICSTIEFGSRRSRWLAWLPLSHLFQRITNLVAWYSSGQIYFLSDPHRFRQALATVRPHITISVPKMLVGLMVDSAKSSSPKSEPSAQLNAICGGHLELVFSGSATLPPEVTTFFDNAGVTILESYGVTENIVPMSINRPAKRRSGSVGVPLEPNSVILLADGEVAVKGAGVFDGYWPEFKSDDIFTTDGYYRTGDRGSIDGDGFLFLAGRQRSDFKTSNGKRVAPEALEAAISLSPMIDQCFLYGHGRPFVAALIVPAEALLMRLRESQVVSEGTALRETLADELSKLCAPFPRYARICAFQILTEPFSPQNGLLTSTLKLKRKNIEEKYADTLELLYRNSEVSQ